MTRTAAEYEFEKRRELPGLAQAAGERLKGALWPISKRTGSAPPLSDAVTALMEAEASEMARANPAWDRETCFYKVRRSPLGRTLAMLDTVPQASWPVDQALDNLVKHHPEFVCEVAAALPTAESGAEIELRKIAEQLQRADPSLTMARAEVEARRRFPALHELVQKERGAP